MTPAQIESILLWNVEVQMRTLTEYGHILPEVQAILDAWTSERNGNH